MVSAAAPAIALIGCGDDSGTAIVDEPSCIDNGTDVSIGSNHGHTLTVSKADIDRGVDAIYNIQGSSGHNHSVTITADQFLELQANNSISVSSSSDNDHTHFITVKCES